MRDDKNMVQVLDDLFHLFDAFEAMQQDHIRAIKNYETAHPDMIKFNTDRRFIFEKIKQSIGLLSSREIQSQLVQDRLIKIKKMEAVISRQITIYKEKLLEKKKKMLCGKRFLSGYGKPYLTFSPRLISRPI